MTCKGLLFTHGGEALLPLKTHVLAPLFDLYSRSLTSSLHYTILAREAFSFTFISSSFYFWQPFYTLFKNLLFQNKLIHHVIQPETLV